MLKKKFYNICGRLYLKKLVVLSAIYDNFEFKSKEHAKKNQHFMELILRTTNLVIVTIISEYLLLIVNGSGVGEHWLVIGHTINVLCIYLSFGAVNDRLYNKLCCCVHRHCHKCCASLCFCCCLPKSEINDVPVSFQAISKSNSSTNNTKIEFATIELTPNKSNIESNKSSITQTTEMVNTPSNIELNIELNIESNFVQNEKIYDVNIKNDINVESNENDEEIP